MDLPPITTGTDKQIAYATDLRAQAVEQAATYRLVLINDDPMGEDVEYTQKTLDAHDAHLAWVLTHTTASWWLDVTHRGWRPLNTLAKAALKYQAKAAADPTYQLDPTYR